MHRWTRSTLLITLLLGGGCAADTDSEPLEMAQLEGSVGDLEHFSGFAWSQTVASFEDGASLDFRFRDAEYAMLMVSIGGAELGEGRLAPGETVVIHNPNGCGFTIPPREEPELFEEDDVDGIYVDVIGCSGDNNDEWQWDCPADDVTLAIEEGVAPGTLRMVITASFDDGVREQTATVTADVDLALARRAGTGGIYPPSGIDYVEPAPAD